MIDKKITFVFGSGRKNKIESEKNYAKEFFYSYFDLKKKYVDTNLIEFNDNNRNRLLINIDKLLRKLSGLSFFTNSIIKGENYKVLKNSDIVIATNDRIGLSVLPMIKLIKIRKQMKFCVIVMGLFSNRPKNKSRLKLQNTFLSTLLKTADEFIFLGKPELMEASDKYPEFKEKFTFIPFSIDETYWKGQVKDFSDREGILFIGNDSHRDYKFSIDLANKMPNINFTFITSQINEIDVLSENVSLIEGKWNNQKLSDENLREIYNNSKLVIVPLKNSLQPSGQSVTLQSMAMGTPVLITMTDGFWDLENYKNNENIVFLNENTLNEWVEKIESIYYDSNKLKKISESGKSTIMKEYKIENFTNNLEKLISK